MQQINESRKPRRDMRK